MSTDTGLPWFRLYSEFCVDPQVQMLSFDDQRHFVMAMCMKRRGILDKPYTSRDVRARVIAMTLGLEPVAASEANRRLVEMGLVDTDWQPVAWERRQPKSDSDGAERARRYRDRRNANVTEPSRDSHGLERERDSERDKDQRESALSLVRIPECPKDMDVEAEGQSCADYYREQGKRVTPNRWRSWVLRAANSGVYARLKSRPPTEAEIQAARRDMVERMAKDS